MKRWLMVFLLTFSVMILFQGSLAEAATLPNGLTAVEDEAFYGDESLEAIVLPEGLKTIGSKAFADTGLTAVNLPSSLAYCDCHPISSFQWIVTKLLKENGVPYRVEVSFPDLYGAGHVNLLRYDFGVYDKKGKLKCLIECQGEQHYEPVEEFGGTSQFTWQQRNDALKRNYAEENGIPLYEIPYKNKRFEKVESFLKEKGILS